LWPASLFDIIFSLILIILNICSAVRFVDFMQDTQEAFILEYLPEIEEYVNKMNEYERADPKN